MHSEEGIKHEHCSSSAHLHWCLMNMMPGLATLPILWLLLMLAHHGESRLVPTNMFDLQHDESTEAVGVSTLKGQSHHHAAAPTPVPCNWVCDPKNNYHCDCVPIPSPIPPQDALLLTQDSIDSTAAALLVGDVKVAQPPLTRMDNAVGAPVGAPQSDEASSIEGLRHVATRKPVPCIWVCSPDNNYHCDCVPIPVVKKGLGV